MIPEGYKQTEIGVIPEEWNIKDFGKVGNYYKGGGISMKDVRPIGLPCIMYGDIYVKFDTSFKECDYRIDSTTAKNSVKALPQDLFFTASGETADDIGRCVSYQGKDDIYIGGDIIALHPSDEYDSLFLSYVQNSENVKKQKASFAQGHSVVHISMENIKKTIFASPKYKEQRRIAEALSDVDELIASLEKLIEKKKALKQGVMQELLTGKRRLPGFTGEWKKKRIKDIGIQIEKGQILTQQEATIGSIPVVAGGRQPAYYCDTFNRSGVNITISASGASAGFVNLYDGQIFASDCSTIGESPCYNIIFIYNALLNIQQKIYAVQTGGAQPHVHPSELYDLELYYTFDVQEQTAIASVLSDLDNEIVAKENELEKYKQLKSGMMSELLTGKIRLIEGE